MATYYLNAGSIIQDGLTPTTGCHNLTILNSTVSLVDEDIVYLVDNGNIIEDNGTIIDKVISFLSWTSNTKKPTWVLSEWGWGDPSFRFITPTLGTIIIRDLNIKGTGLVSSLGFGGENTTFDIRYCFFDKAMIDVGLLQSGYSNSFLCANNTFINVPKGNNLGIITVHVGVEHPDALCDCKIICNTFYGGTTGVQFYEHVSGKVFGNVFLNQERMCIYRGGSSLRDLWAIEIDYNITYGNGWLDINISDPPPDLDSWIGPHNLRGINPLLMLPSRSNFHPSVGSPCFNSCIGYSVDSDIPTDDYEKISRNPSLTTIGALSVSDSAPMFIEYPHSIIKYINQNGSFSAPTVGFPTISYQWRHDSTLLTDNRKISGSDTSSITVHNIVTGDVGYYTVRAYNGILPDATASAFLAIGPFPQFFAADFTSSITHGLAPVTVDFTNQTIEQSDTTVIFTAHQWKFGDKSTDSTTIDASHFYAQPGGTIPVTLIETRDFVDSGRTKTLLIDSSAINYYDDFPIRDSDSSVISTIRMSILLPMLVGDSYFTDDSKISRVDLNFIHENGWQKKYMIHTGPDLTCSVNWTDNARLGLWKLESFRVYDTDGAIRDFGRINSYSDVAIQ